jgi:hypothetical protein
VFWLSNFIKTLKRIIKLETLNKIPLIKFIKKKFPNSNYGPKTLYNMLKLKSDYRTVERAWHGQPVRRRIIAEIAENSDIKYEDLIAKKEKISPEDYSISDDDSISDKENKNQKELNKNKTLEERPYGLIGQEAISFLTFIRQQKAVALSIPIPPNKIEEMEAIAQLADACGMKYVNKGKPNTNDEVADLYKHAINVQEAINTLNNNSFIVLQTIDNLSPAIIKIIKVQKGGGEMNKNI